ncbi:zinc finger protein 501-like [Belonocnema kinseyi]|uniref:zinc finger protein 501-like n=1 Tax=Belonocnema kinseyi TaxID=2817044 RepID=UPI00143D9867|nr:zinc finger protein 501-like [Belonocnema kinseyi]
MADLLPLKIHRAFGGVFENPISCTIGLNLGPKQRRSRGQGRYICQKCGRRYYEEKNLRRHLMHECGKQPFRQCNFCQYKSIYKFYLEKHMQKHRENAVSNFNSYIPP